jgi:hypothetical protein
MKKLGIFLTFVHEPSWGLWEPPCKGEKHHGGTHHHPWQIPVGIKEKISGKVNFSHKQFCDKQKAGLSNSAKFSCSAASLDVKN